MVYNDDEPILKGQQNVSEEEADLELDGNTEARITNKSEAPLEETPFKVLLDLKGVGSDEGRLGVDLVTILDISGSMRGNKLTKLKLAMQFLLQKLSGIDRLSVVTFNRQAEKLCPLRQITEKSRTEIEKQVNALQAGYSTNTAAGLEMALDVLKGRIITKRRRVAIMLMSDGNENNGSDAANVPLGSVPVYTFGFGTDYNPELLSGLANKSNGGMFSPVSNEDNLNLSFSLCLAGLLNVAIDDLTLTVTPDSKSTINKVNAGNYQKSNEGDVGAVTVSFGSLYDRETRKVLVELTLPKVDKRQGANVLNIVYKYRAGGNDAFKSDRRIINVTRIPKSTEPEKEEVLAEEKRLQTVKAIKEARLLADAKRLEEAREKLVDAKTSILDEVYDTLRSELDQLLVFMASQETYDKQGRAFALATEASHDRQRSVARGDVEKLGSFDIPAMELYVKQAMLFDKDPQNYPVPTQEEDKKVIADKYPLPPVDIIVNQTPLFVSIVESLKYYIDKIIQLIKSIVDRFK